MSNEVTLDLTTPKLKINLLLDEGVSANPSINGITNLDTGYTLTVGAVTKTVGSGLTLTTNGIVINIDGTEWTAGIYYGCLVSDSRVAGVYKFFDLTVNVKALDNC